MICHHIPETRRCHCGLKYQRCPICEPNMKQCVSCNEEFKQRRPKETAEFRRYVQRHNKSRRPWAARNWKQKGRRKLEPGDVGYTSKYNPRRKHE